MDEQEVLRTNLEGENQSEIPSIGYFLRSTPYKLCVPFFLPRLPCKHKNPKTEKYGREGSRTDDLAARRRVLEAENHSGNSSFGQFLTRLSG